MKNNTDKLHFPANLNDKLKIFVTFIFYFIKKI